MYSIDFENLHKAAEIIYCFMTLPALTKPECTLWNDDGFPDTVTNTGKGFMSEEKFCRWMPEVRKQKDKAKELQL